MRSQRHHTSLPVGNKRPVVVIDGPFAETKEYALCSRRPAAGVRPVPSRTDRMHPIQPRAA